MNKLKSNPLKLAVYKSFVEFDEQSIKQLFVEILHNSLNVYVIIDYDQVILYILNLHMSSIQLTH